MRRGSAIFFAVLRITGLRLLLDMNLSSIVFAGIRPRRRGGVCATWHGPRGFINRLRVGNNERFASSGPSRQDPRAQSEVSPPDRQARAPQADDLGAFARMCE